MAYTAKTLVQGTALGTAAGILYTAPAGTYARVTQCSLANTDSVPRTVTVYLVDDALAPGVADTAVKSKTLAANETWVPYQILGAVISPGGTLQALCDAAAVVVFKASGLELT